MYEYFTDDEILIWACLFLCVCLDRFSYIFTVTRTILVKYKVKLVKERNWEKNVVHIEKDFYLKATMERWA